MAEVPFVPCDVSLVARFDQWEHAVTTEARALFFLASWLELTNPRVRAAFPLHLTCVGEPPGSVQGLAAACGARMRVADRSTPTCLLAIDVAVVTGRLFVVEGGTVILRGPEHWDHAGATLLLTPASKPAEGMDWPGIYAGAGIPAPSERINSARADLRGVWEPMWPFYQSRSFWTSEPAGLREAWAKQLEAQPDERVALTLASQALGGAGRLPDSHCARIAHWEAGALLPGEAALFQASGLFQGLTDPSEIRPRIDAYGARVSAAIESGFAARPWWTRQRARRGGGSFRSRLHGLFRRHVAPALRASGAYV